MSTVKKKHHFVSQFYLKKWCKNTKIYSSDGKKIFSVDIKKTGLINHLYKIRPLSLPQRNLFHDTVRHCELEKLSTYTLTIKSIFNSFDNFLLCKSLNQKAMKDFENDLDALNDFKPLKDSLDKRINLFQSNTLEDYFSSSESRFNNTLGKIHRKEMDTLTLLDYDTLIHFFILQLGRTPKELSLDKDKLYKNFKFTDEKFDTFRLLLTLCFVEKIYLSIISKLFTIKIYHNQSEIDFITSDDPSFNQDKEDFLVQLPISPKIMLELSRSTRNETEIKEFKKYFNFHKNNTNLVKVNNILFYEYTLNENNQIDDINKKIFNHKNKFIYANSEEVLQRYLIGN